MVDVYSLESLSNEELLDRIKDQEVLVLQFDEDIKGQEYQDEWVQEQCLKDSQALWDELNYMKFLAKERGLKYG